MDNHIGESRIGESGGVRPSLTVRGKPVPRNITTVYNLGHGHYCVGDVVTTDETAVIVAELREEVEVKYGPKRKNRKPSKAAGDEGCPL
ncbi:hypothetical protein LCGC14_2155740 [marine sediment metagenome]|uniref:Uncharacterized protein n=1 Tax=marine sediment metagenome TaxID=412755 RepID=A0A0F9DUE6_9ZZZZ|nr:hypothetical protein [Porticoccus sp.]